MEVLVFVFPDHFLLAASAPVFPSTTPAPCSTSFEGVDGFIEGQSHEIIGHHSEQYTPFLTSLASSS